MILPNIYKKIYIYTTYLMLKHALTYSHRKNKKKINNILRLARLRFKYHADPSQILFANEFKQRQISNKIRYHRKDIVHSKNMH